MFPVAHTHDVALWKNARSVVSCGVMKFGTIDIVYTGKPPQDPTEWELLTFI